MLPTIILPLVGTSSFIKSRIRVLLPAPEAPTIVTNSFGFICSETPDNATVLFGYITDTLSSKIICIIVAQKRMMCKDIATFNPNKQ